MLAFLVPVQAQYSRDASTKHVVKWLEYNARLRVLIKGTAISRIDAAKDRTDQHDKNATS